MTLNTFPDQNASRPRRPWLEGILLTGFFFLLILGVLALAAFFFLTHRTPASPVYDSPLSILQPEQIRSDLALRQLAGDPADALAYQALNAGELYTAHAIALFDTGFAGNNATALGTGSPNSGLVGSKRAGFYQQLAGGYLERGLNVEAGAAYDTLRSLTILDIEIPALERATLLTQAAEGLLALGAEEEALDAANQALLMGKQIPDLLPAQRVQIFQGLKPLADELGDEAFSAQVNDLLRNPYLTPAGVLLTSQLWTFAEPVAPDQPLLDAIQARQIAANQLAERIKFTGGEDIEPERQALAAALLSEEQARIGYYQRMTAAQPTLGQQLWLLSDQRAWAALKLRIAMQGFGLSILPEWEANLAGIQQDLSTVTGSFDLVTQALAATLVDPIYQQMMEVEGLQWLALQADLGLDPGSNTTDLSSRLRVVQQGLAQVGAPLALPVAYDENAVPPGFRIQPGP
jgi:hypothetical protein